MLLVEGRPGRAPWIERSLPTPSFRRNGSVDKIQRSGTIRIGVISDAPGFSRLDPESGDFKGLDICVSRRLGGAIFGTPLSELEQHIDYVELGLPDRVPALVDDQVDAVVSVFSVTPERQRLIDFTTPYYGAPLVMVVRDDSPITEVTDLRKSTVALVASTVEAELVHKEQLARGVVEFGSNDETLHAVQTGQADAVLMCKTLFDGFSSADSGLRSIAGALDHYSFAVGVRKGDDELREVFDAEVSDMITSGFIAAADAYRRRTA